MVQPRVKNRNELKILVVNGEPKLPTTKAYGFKNKLTEIFAFCTKVVRKLKARFPELMDEYILRVDLFEVDGKLKVNEFESFDADVLMNVTHLKRKFEDGTTPSWTDSDTNNFILEFWKTKLQELFSIKTAIGECV